MKKLAVAGIVLVFSLLTFGAVSGAAVTLTEEEELGKTLYWDSYLSIEHNQSCGTCHAPSAGWADPLNALDPVWWPVSLGSDGVSVGGRNAPVSAYAAFSPPFHYDPATEQYVGGQFWDGRARGLKAQAKGPFLNPVEMAVPSKVDLLRYVAGLAVGSGPEKPNPLSLYYVDAFMSVYGVDLPNLNWSNHHEVNRAYDKVAEAIAAYESTEELCRFTSRYDAYLEGRQWLTPTEAQGLELFVSNCAQCHPEVVDGQNSTAPGPVFTTFEYYNLGLPKNDSLVLEPYADWIDEGLYLNPDVSDAAQRGKFKTPTLRNVALSAPYGHNGYFATLEEMVAFINDRSGYEPEVPENLTEIVGSMGLTSSEVDDIVAFLNTLTDSN